MNEGFIYSGGEMAPRKEAQTRLAELLDAGITVFGARGFRRARIDEVAALAGVSPGNVYRYVTGKDALFRYVMERAIEGPDWPLPEGPFPLDGPSAAATARWVGRRLDYSDFPVMAKALRRRSSAPADELEAVVRELFAVLQRTRHAITILERSAPEMPELAAIFLGVRRELFERMNRYLTARIRAGQFLPLASAPAAARLLIEATVWAANRRLQDPDPQTVLPDDAAQAALLQLAQRMLIGDERSASA
jgi:AcrR family transcriptional regulator